MTIRVVRAFLNDHEVVAVNCSPLPTRPWTAVDVAKGWTIACRDEDLTDPRPLECSRPVPTYQEVFAPAGENVVVGGRSSKAQMQAFADLIGVPDLPRIVAEGVARIERGIHAAFTEDRWRVIGPDNDPYTGEAPEAWGYLTDTLDRYGFIDRIEQHVDGTWRVRSVRDLLTAAGGDPL